MLFVLLSKGRRVVLEAFSTACSLLEDRDAIAGLGRRDSAFIGLLVPVLDNAVRDVLLTAGGSWAAVEAAARGAVALMPMQ